MTKLQPPAIVQALLAAQRAGNQAADSALDRLRERHGDREQYDYAAGAVLHLRVRLRSELGRVLSAIASSAPHLVSVWPATTKSEIIVAIPGMSNRQEQSVNIAAEEAALDVLKNRLGVDGYVTSIES